MSIDSSVGALIACISNKNTFGFKPSTSILMKWNIWNKDLQKYLTFTFNNDEEAGMVVVTAFTILLVLVQIYSILNILNYLIFMNTLKSDVVLVVVLMAISIFLALVQAEKKFNCLNGLFMVTLKSDIVLVVTAVSILDDSKLLQAEG